MRKASPLPARPLNDWRAPASPTIRYAATTAIGFLVLFNIALISLSIASIPIRGILATGMLGILALAMPELLRSAMTRHALVLVLAALLALLGTFVSLANGAEPSVIVRMLMEVHLQTVITVLLAVMLAELAGPRAAVMAICAAIGFSAFIAALQFIGLDAAWGLRELLGDVQGHNLREDSSFLNRRPMGVSYSPIHLATHACLAFAAYAAWRLGRWKPSASVLSIDWAIVFALALMVAISFLGANRSPILGAAIFLVVYAVRYGSAISGLLVAMACLALLAAAPVIYEAMQGAETRVFRVGDNSFLSRLPLLSYGVLLLLDNPLGYGFGFEAHQHWSRFWPDLYTLPSADSIRSKELHNYPINMLTTYGVGLLLAVPLVAKLFWSSRYVLIAFVPYAVHVLFHNTGPFWNDVIFWFVVGALSAMQVSTRATPKPARPVRVYRPRPGVYGRRGRA